MKTKDLSEWVQNSTWDNSKNIDILYKQRCQKKTIEMTAHKQVVSILKEICKKGESVLDIGCGSGYLYHSFINKKLDVEYFGIDASKKLLNIGKKYLPKFGLDNKRLIHSRFEDLSVKFDHIVCINVLTYHDNLFKPLDIFLKNAKKSIILRESFAIKSNYKYVRDNYLNDGVDLKTYINTYSMNEVRKFLNNHKVSYKFIKDNYTNGKMQKVIGHNHYWKFLKILK